MKRLITFAPSGSHVVACGRSGGYGAAGDVHLVPARRGEDQSCSRGARCAATHSDSVPPRFVYWFCTIARICRTSRSVAVPGCAALATAAFGQLVAASGVSGPVKVESEMLFQSTWNL